MKTKSVKDYLTPKSKKYILRDLDKLPKERLNETLFSAATYNHIFMIQPLIDKGANVNAIDYFWSPLLCAARYGHIKVVKILLDNGADKNISNRWGLSAMDYARDYGRKNLLKLLKNYK